MGNEEGIYDVLIIGAGPAGLTAGLYSARARLSTAIIETGRKGGQAATTEDVENYPGFPGGTTGPELMKLMTEQVEGFGVTFIKDRIEGLELGSQVKVAQGRNGEYKAKSLIVATGAKPRTLGLPGEGSLRGKGVSYCATCDGEIFTDLDVIVIGNGDAAVEEAIFLTRFADKVTIIVVHDEGVMDAAKYLQERAFANPKIDFVWNSVVDEIKGEGIVEAVTLKNLKTGNRWEIQTNGVFIFVGTVPQTDFCKGQIEMDDRGYIITDERMQTSEDGVYAAGDVTQKYLRQIVTACGDGATAAVAAEKFLEEEESFREQVLESDRPVVVGFWSPTDEESMGLLKSLEEVEAKRGTGIRTVAIDLYRNQRVARRFGVTKPPAVLVFVGGQLRESMHGSVGATDIIKALD